MPTNQHPHHTGGHASQPHHPRHAAKPDGPVLVPPKNDDKTNDNQNAAVDLIRQKLASIYGDEPDARQEMAEAQLPGVQHSKHQQYMLSLHQSGKSASEIQTAWHQYYLSLDDIEKRQVWQEFYDQSARVKQQPSRIEPHYTYTPEETQPTPTAKTEPGHPTAIYPTPTAFTNDSFGMPPKPATAATTAHVAPTAINNPLITNATPTPIVSHSPQDVAPVAPAAADERPPETIRQQLRDTVNSRSSGRTLKAKHHFQSLLFGLGFGLLTLVVVLFSFFNEVVIAPFIQPSRNVSATPIIISPDGVTATDKNEVIIPKINVEIPLDFSATSTEEKAFEAALDKGVAHYPTTALPGQQGNASFFGHSSNNIFNPGKYKFAFVLLNELVPGDTFYITHNGVAYAYTVYDKKVVEATAVEILNPVPGKTATAMLVTCDPPGTSLRRLAVWGEQISPNPSSNIAATPAAQSQPKDSDALPGNGPTLWGRVRNWITGN
jgi:LPXTG-site transpeptidase (sortase) family protein